MPRSAMRGELRDGHRGRGMTWRRRPRRCVVHDVTYALRPGFGVGPAPAMQYGGLAGVHHGLPKMRRLRSSAPAGAARG